MKQFDTKTIQIGIKHYCVYCGKEANNEFRYADRERWDYYNCDCDKAIAELDYEKQLKELSKKFKPLLNPDVGTKEILNELRYENDLSALKEVYGKNKP